MVPVLWSVFHKSYFIAFLSFCFFVVSRALEVCLGVGGFALMLPVNLFWLIYCGSKGNEWAWKGNSWPSVSDFYNAQKRWATVAWTLISVGFVFLLISILSFQGGSYVPTDSNVPYAWEESHQSPGVIEQAGVLTNIDPGSQCEIEDAIHNEYLCQAKTVRDCSILGCRFKIKDRSGNVLLDEIAEHVIFLGSEHNGHRDVVLQQSKLMPRVVSDENKLKFVYVDSLSRYRKIDDYFTTSFDCYTDLNVAEEAICSSPILSEMDQKMASLYKQKLYENRKPINVLETEQKAWLAQRNSCIERDEPEHCLQRAYNNRISVLEAPLEIPTPTLPPALLHDSKYAEDKKTQDTNQCAPDTPEYLRKYCD